MKLLDNILRIGVGAFFIFSGLIKINDPQGTAIKLEEYFEVFSSEFGAFFEIFVPASLGIAVFVIVLEVVLGVALIIGYQMRITAWILLALILFFTALTFYSAVTGNVTDCGCFGDAIVISPWASFYKDVILLVLIGYLFARKNKLQPFVKGEAGHFTMTAAAALNIFIAIYAIRHLPYIDFRPYHTGANIPTYMKPSEQLRFMYIMEKEGEEYEFENYPSDTTYTFREMVALNPEAQPKITDYSVWNAEGDFTEETFQGEKLLIIIENIRKSDPAGIEKVKKLVENPGSEAEPMILTATDEPTFQTYRHEYQLAVPFYFADGTVLKAMIRANPGIMLLKNGTILGKWHHNDTPTAERIRELLNKN